MASVRISRTPASGGNRKTFTFSAWIKRANLEDTTQTLLMAGDSDGNNNISVLHLKDNKLEFYTWVSGYQFQMTTNRLFRDTSAWYHIVVAVDTTQNTALDRVKFYVNGTQETSLANSSAPSQDYDTFINHTVLHGVANYNAGSSQYFSGCMAHVHFTDGYAYDASTFGETDSTSGIWKPKTNPSVTYGTNGFFLKFENSGNLDLDSSGNNLTFTTSGTLTQNVDTPSNNFAILNPLIQSGVGTLTNGNLTHSSTAGISHTISSFGITKGKWYAEAKYTGGGNYNGVGFVSEPILPTTTAWYNSPYNATLTYTNVYNNGSGLGTYATPSTNDIIGMAVDADNGFIYFSNNGTFGNSGVPTSGSTGTGGIATSVFSGNTNTIFFASEQDATPGTRNAEWNFGSGFFGTTAVASANADANGFGAFEYAVPSGYYALCTKNIKEFG